MRIAVDAMGGDHAPQQIVTGTLQAAGNLPHVDTFFLVGDEAAIKKELSRHSSVPRSIQIRHASSMVEMDEAPVLAIRRKKDSSIVRAVDLVKGGEADAVFSAGNTGASVAATTLKLRKLEGVSRPAIATVFPTPKKPFVLLDAGATPDCTATMLLEFGIMGAVYAEEILAMNNPRVGLLNIGGEEAKGNETTKDAFQRLESSGLHFSGNVENLFEGKVDVAVCDGFVGNVVLKTSESVAKAMGKWLKDEFTSNPIHMLGAFLLSPGLKRIKRRSDPAQYGGALLLGVNGVCIIGHGSSSARAVENGLRVATEFVSHGLNNKIIERVKKVKESIPKEAVKAL